MSVEYQKLELWYSNPFTFFGYSLSVYLAV